MKRQKIENRDQELIKKIRTIVHNNEKIKETETAPKRFPFGMIILLTTLIISSMLLLKQYPAILFPKEHKAPSRGERVLVTANQQASTVDTVEIKAPDIPEIPTPAREMVDKNPVPANLITRVLGQKSCAEFSNKNLPAAVPSGIRIEKLISCSRVINKQYNGPKSKFSLALDTTPKIWMKVISENPPFTLTHVYYCNGRQYCEVPLAIRYHRMRTWSSVTLRSPDKIGKWRVEVIDDNGVKLDQVEFIVVK